MILQLSVKDRVRLRRAACGARGAVVRRRATWVLLIAGGLPIARLARLAGVSRPTVYRYLQLWIATRDPAALRSEGSGRLRGMFGGDQKLAAKHG